MTLTEFLSATSLPGKLLFAKLWGSRSHNTHLETSDWDFSGVYVAPTESLLGLSSRRIPETTDNPSSIKPDYSFHEVGKFCDLLLKGNPAITEMLFTDKNIQWSKHWDELVANRKKFLSRAVVGAYVGFADGQLKRINAGRRLDTSGGNYSEKWAYHMIRVLKDASRIVAGGEPLVWKDGEERDVLMNIRYGKTSREEVIDISSNLLAKINELYPWEPLPEKGDEEFLQRWLLKIRSDFYTMDRPTEEEIAQENIERDRRLEEASRYGNVHTRD